MENTRQNSSLRRFFESRLFLIFAIPITILVIFGFLRSYYSGYKINQEIAELENEIKNLERKKIESMELLDYVLSDSFVEEKARTELNLKKPGEKVLVLNAGHASKNINNIEDTNNRQELSNPIKWLYYFINKDKIIN